MLVSVSSDSCWSGSAVDSVCVQLVVSVELLVSAVQLSTSCLQPSPVGTGSPSSAAPASVARHSLLYDIHTNLAQIIQQLARDIDVFWQVTYTQLQPLTVIISIMFVLVLSN